MGDRCHDCVVREVLWHVFESVRAQCVITSGSVTLSVSGPLVFRIRGLCCIVVTCGGSMAPEEALRGEAACGTVVRYSCCSVFALDNNQTAVERHSNWYHDTGSTGRGATNTSTVCEGCVPLLSRPCSVLAVLVSFITKQ